MQLWLIPIFPLLGAVFLIYVPELLSFSREMRPALMGLLLILVTLFMPGGLIGWLRPHVLRLVASRRRVPSPDKS